MDFLPHSPLDHRLKDSIFSYQVLIRSEPDLPHLTLSTLSPSGAMSAILSADDLNDFISPGVACIKPVETLPLQQPQKSEVRFFLHLVPSMLISHKNAYEVTHEDNLTSNNHAPAQISLTDCLACSGCVTSAEAVLVSLQSQTEVLNALDAHPPFEPSRLQGGYADSSTQTTDQGMEAPETQPKLFVASISPQVRASIAATYYISEVQAGNLISQLLSGSEGLASGGNYHNAFTWIIDTNAMREACLVLGADEVFSPSLPSDTLSPSSSPTKPVLTSACPGWICYAEKTQPHILPHLSRLKSPQALTGTLLKTVFSKRLGIPPAQIWHLAIMPCFDKKLEASREELTDIYWSPTPLAKTNAPVRDTDCVITARELLMLADTRGISLPSLPLTPPPTSIPFPDPTLSAFLFPPTTRPSKSRTSLQRGPETGTSGGYLAHILATYLSTHPTHTLHTQRGRNADVVDFSILDPSGEVVFKAARYYGFKNITNLVRKLRPPKGAGSRMPGATGARKAGAGIGAGGAGTGLDYVEVMACPGGCTNGGGQIKGSDTAMDVTPKAWLAKVDEAYWSASDEEAEPQDIKDLERGCMAADARDGDVVNGIDTSRVRRVLDYWATSTGIEVRKLAYTSYRLVESEVGKGDRSGGQERVVELAGRMGGGW